MALSVNKAVRSLTSIAGIAMIFCWPLAAPTRAKATLATSPLPQQEIQAGLGNRFSGEKAADHHTWLKYRNERFGTVALYPSDLFRHSSLPDNGDGITLRSDSGGKLLIFGSWNVGNLTPATYAKSLIEADARYRGVTYRMVKPKLLILSGVANGRIFYERYDFSDPSSALHGIVIEYPIGSRAIYDPIMPKLSASLKWTHPRI